jgi:hypothetical protein
VAREQNKYQRDKKPFFHFGSLSELTLAETTDVRHTQVPYQNARAVLPDVEFQSQRILGHHCKQAGDRNEPNQT